MTPDERRRPVDRGELDSQLSYRLIEELSRSERRFRRLVEQLHEVVFQTDSELCFTFLNPAWSTVTGYAVADATGQQLAEFIANTSLKAWEGFLRAREEGKQEYSIPELSLQLADGGQCWVVLSLNRDPDRAEGGWTGSMHDLTERRRAEERRRGLEAHALHGQKLESLGVLAGGIAHDFNNLLLGILGNAGLALREPGLSAPAQEHLREVEAISTRAADLCRQLLAYSGKGKFVVQSIDLNHVVREIAHLLELSISKKAVIRYHLDQELPPVKADVAEMQQLVMNLMINASEALNEEIGSVGVTTGALTGDVSYLREFELGEELAVGEYVFLEVSDTGVGMDDETIGKIFDPFFSTKFTGRGLGLSAALGIVRGHGGGLKVYSERGRGTTFKILLPVSHDPVQAQQGSVSPEESWRGQGVVLLADDEPAIQRVGKKMLEAMGFSVLVAADGQEAVELFREHRDEIVCVVLDLTMPRMDGRECFYELRSLDCNVRILISSGYSEQEVTASFVGKGLAGFMQKPFRMSALQQKLRLILG